MQKKHIHKIDKIVSWAVAITLIYSFFILVKAYLSGEEIGPWIWNRHQNLFSWYSRPLFIIPACYYAYRHKIWLSISMILLIFTSLFWFEAPQNIPESVSNYLEWEKQLFLINESIFPLVFLIIAVVIFLFSLFYAFWKRNLWYGVIVLNCGTILKIIVSLVAGGELGKGSIVPSISSILLINITAFLVWKFVKNKKPKGN